RMDFLKAFGASLLALVIFSALVFISFLIIVSVMSAEKQVQVRPNTVLHLELDGPINEMQRDDPLAGLPIPGAAEQNIGLMQLKQAIENAKTNENIKGIYLECSYLRGGFSTIEEIRQSLIDFRESGKFVVAYNETMSEGAYYLATAADAIYLNPEGDVEFNGLAIEVTFFKRLFDKLQFRPLVFRVGEFKSAVEPFLMEQMSPENELQLTELANGINDVIISHISEARKISVEKLREMSDNMQVRTARIAKEFGLVDELYYNDEFNDELRRRLGIGENDKINFIGYRSFNKVGGTYNKSKNDIAVIV